MEWKCSWEYHHVTADEDDRDTAYAEGDGLARWTPWVDFESGAKVIDRLPGVYRGCEDSSNAAADSILWR